MPDTKVKYPYIVKWGRLLGSFSYYIDAQVKLAREEGAPTNAIYRRDDGTWATTDDVTSLLTRSQLGLAADDE